MSVTDPYERIIVRGVTLNRRTAAMLTELERRLGRAVDGIAQGSYHLGTSQSAGTHDGGGAIDITDHDLDHVQHAGRAVGFAMWHRPTIPGLWGAHCHGIALADKEMSDGARAQIPDYRNYLDGLASHAADNTWHPFPKGDVPRPIFNYAKWLKEQDMDLSDKLPADAEPGTVGEALKRANHLDEFRAAVKADQEKTRASVAEAKDEIKTLATEVEGVHDQLAATQIKLTAMQKAILDAVKNP